MQIYITNADITITEISHPYICKSDALVALLLCGSEVPVAFTLPTTDKSIVALLLSYLQYGCVPHKMDNLVTTDLEKCMRYLGTDDVKLVSFSDRVLNRFTVGDMNDNRNTELLVLYANVTQMDLLPHSAPKYPVVLPPTKKMKFPKNLTVALNKIFACSRCRRYQFVERVFEVISNVVVAGGCLQFMASDKHISFCDSTDIDFFLIDGGGPPLAALVHQFGEIYQEHFGKYFCMRTEYAVTFFKVRRRHRNVVQIILKPYPTVEAVLNSFDVDASCFAFNGQALLCNRRGWRSWKTRHNAVDVTRQSPTYVRRLLKYNQKYGFGVCDPGFIPSRLVTLAKPWTGLASLIGTSKDRAQYGSCYSGFPVCESSSIPELVTKIQQVVNFTRHVIPFVLRYKNSDVFSLTQLEEEKLPQSISLFNSVEFQYPVCSDAWYAQAYGLSLVEAQPRRKSSLPALAWTLHTGRHTLCRHGLQFQQ